MSDINPFAQQHADIRRGVREVCRSFDSAYWQHLEESSGSPEAFVQALTEGARRTPRRLSGSGEADFWWLEPEVLLPFQLCLPVPEHLVGHFAPHQLNTVCRFRG